MKPQVLRKLPSVRKLVVATGDPDRLFMLASLLDESNVVFNQRGIVVINGRHRNLEITLASHGIGCPMASIIFEELWMLGARWIVRLGTAGSLTSNIGVGDVILASGAGYKGEGCGVNMYSSGIHCGASPDPFMLVGLYEELVKIGISPVVTPVFTSDAFYAEEELADNLSKRGFKAVDMETAALYMLSWMRGFKAASVLVVSNVVPLKTELKNSSELGEVFTKVFLAVLNYFEKSHRSSITNDSGEDSSSERLEGLE